jgi:hypothetical protein
MLDQPQGEKPALTVVIQSWWTPALALLMLVIGLLAGYFGRPLLNKGSSVDQPVAAITTPTTINAPEQLINPTSVAVDPTMAAISSKQQLMDYLVSHTTQFEGDPNAKVTIIEFSDYQ